MRRPRHPRLDELVELAAYPCLIERSGVRLRSARGWGGSCPTPSPECPSLKVQAQAQACSPLIGQQEMRQRATRPAAQAVFNQAQSASLMPRNRSLPAGAALTVELLSVYLRNNTVAVRDVPDLIRSTRIALTEAKAPTLGGAGADNFTPAVSVRKSLVSSEHILSMIDGKPYRALRRHLAAHGLTPESYRDRYNLSADYPMVAPGYAAYRRALAQQIGLGKNDSAQKVRSNEAGAIVAPLAVKATAAEVRSLKAVEEHPGADVNPSMPATEEKGGLKRKSSSFDTSASDAAPFQTKELVQESPIPGQVKAKDPFSDLVASRTPKHKGGVTEVPRGRAKLSLFAGRNVEAEVQSHDNGPPTAEADPSSGTDLDGSSQHSPAPVVASGGRLAPELPRRPDEQDGAVVGGTSPRLTLMEAIARKRAVTALYNGAVIKLAAHQIFERRGDLFLTALNLSKNWRADEERRLGQFKFTGLQDVVLLDEAIASLPSYDGKLPRPEDILILAI
jgi:predicted transcriptional regulator